MKKFTVSFVGRQNGAIGKECSFIVDIRAKDEKELPYLISKDYEVWHSMEITKEENI